MEKDAITPFGRRIEKALDAMGWTPSSFNRVAFGVRSGRLFQLLKRDEDASIDAPDLKKLRTMLNVRVEWLLWGEEPMALPTKAPPMVEGLFTAHTFLSGNATWEDLWTVERMIEDDEPDSSTWDAMTWARKLMELHRNYFVGERLARAEKRRKQSEAALKRRRREAEQREREAQARADAARGLASLRATEATAAARAVARKKSRKAAS